MKISDEMRAELRQFRALRRALIERGVPDVIADTLARDAVDECRELTGPNAEVAPYRGFVHTATSKGLGPDEAREIADARLAAWRIGAASKAAKLRDPDFILATIRAATLRGM